MEAKIQGKIPKRGRKPKIEADKYDQQIHTRLTKRQFTAWKAYCRVQKDSEANILRRLVEEALKTLSVDELLKTMELDISDFRK